jgi:hypothetical protein
MVPGDSVAAVPGRAVSAQPAGSGLVPHQRGSGLPRTDPRNPQGCTLPHRLPLRRGHGTSHAPFHRVVTWVSQEPVVTVADAAGVAGAGGLGDRQHGGRQRGVPRHPTSTRGPPAHDTSPSLQGTTSFSPRTRTPRTDLLMCIPARAA